MKRLTESLREVGRAAVVTSPPDVRQILDRAYECLRYRKCDGQVRSIVDVYIGKSVFDSVLSQFTRLVADTFGITGAPMVSRDQLLPYVSVCLEGIELRLVQLPDGSKPSVSIVDLSDIVKGGEVMTPWKHFVWLIEPPAESVALLVATHAGKRLRKRGSCEKCGTQTNWVVDASGRVGAYWCGCGN